MPCGGRGKSRRPGPLLREAKPDGAHSGGPCPHFWGSEASTCCPRARAVRDAAAVCAAGPERSVLLDPHGRCVEVLIIRVSKHDFMWKKGLYRGNRANPQGQCGRQSRRRRKAARWLECRVCKAQNAEDRPRERPGGRRPWSRRRGAWPCGHLVFSRTAELPGHKFQFLEHRDGSRGKPIR